MNWKKGLPTTPGYYWFRNRKSLNDRAPRIELVRSYAGDLAIGNSILKDWELMETGEWAGPIALPEEPLKNWDEVHKRDHLRLHQSLDHLVADFVSQTETLPSRCLLSTLMRWSHQQTMKPTNRR